MHSGFGLSETKQAKQSKSAYELFVVSLSSSCGFEDLVGTLPALSCSPQNPARWSLPWSSSAWWLSWECLQWFGFCTRSTILAPPSSQRSSTTLRSESWIQTSPAWWRLRRQTACHRRSPFLFPWLKMPGPSHLLGDLCNNKSTCIGYQQFN